MKTLKEIYENKRLKISFSNTIIVDNVDTGVDIKTFLHSIKLKNAPVDPNYFLILKVLNLRSHLVKDFELIENLPADGTKNLLIFDDSLDILSKSEKFNEIATAGRHRNLNCVYIKHNLFHKNKTGRDAELQTTHIVFFKSPRDVQQIDILGRQLGLGKQLKQWYDDATQQPYGHLMIDLRPSTPDLLRY